MTITDTTTEPDALLSLQHRYDDLLARHNMWRNDFEKVSAALRDEAIHRGWCEEYGVFVEQMNASLEAGHLLHATETFYATIKITVEFEATPGTQDEVARDISETIYNFGDNLGAQTYTISDHSVTDTSRA